ncbi:MAG: NnrU family protein [Proteobacteria bacterium]|nr:NnrU family protein [Pseudomonadota bacterium]
MEILVIGLVIFFGIHLVPAAPALHRNLQARMGVMGWKGFMALIAIAGFVLIVIGWQRSAFVPVYAPPEFGVWMPRILMLPALILLVAAYLPSNIKRFTRHPMLWGTVLWALAHLFANGDLRSILLFGTFLAWSLFDMWSANRRGARRVEQRIPWFYEAFVFGGGLLAYGLLARFHGALFGMPVMPA